MNYLKYKKMKDTADFGNGAEAAAAKRELEQITPRDRWNYQQWYDAEIMGNDPFSPTSNTQTERKPVSKPTEAVKPTRAVNPTKASKTATKGKDKPVTMSYDDFKWNFNHIGKSNLYSPDNKSPMVRLSEFSRSDPEKYAEYRDRMRKENG